MVSVQLKDFSVCFIIDALQMNPILMAIAPGPVVLFEPLEFPLWKKEAGSRKAFHPTRQTLLEDKRKA